MRIMQQQPKSATMKQLRFLLLLLLLGFSNAQVIAQTFQWAIGMGGPQADSPPDLHIDLFGNVFTAGRFVGTADFDPGPGIVNLTGSGIFFAKYAPNGNLVWARSLASGSNSYSLSMTGDPFGNIILTGHFTGIHDFDPGPGMHFLNSNGGEAVFLAKYDPDGNFLWANSVP